MLENIIYFIGQLFGVVAVILGFVSLQMKTPKGILVFQIIIAFVFSLHYLLISAYTAVALNLLSAVQSIFYYFRNKKGSKSLVVPAVFVCLVVVASVLTWTDWRSAIIMVGVAACSVSFALSDAQMIRKAMYIKSPICLLYNCLVLSVGGIAYECVVLLSSTIGIIKNRDKSGVPAKSE